MLHYDSLREQAVGLIPARVNFWTFLFTFVTVCICPEKSAEGNNPGKDYEEFQQGFSFQ